jgi:tetratricopeptide (TPR) repeat protein
MIERTTILASVDARNEVDETVFDSRTREPVMLEAVRIGTVRSRLGLVAVALASSMMLASPPGTQARQPAASDWVGKAVVPRAPNFTLKHAQRGKPVSAPVEVYHVTEVNGKSVLLATAGITGWAPIDQVIGLEQADSFFANEIRAHSNEPFNHTMRAIVALALHGDLDRALRDLNEAIRLAPRQADSFLIRAEVWRASGDVGKALADCDAVLRLDPTSAGALVIRASIWAANKEYDKAIADYSEVIRRDPQVVPAYFGRAAVQGEKGEIDKAIADLGTAIHLNPQLPDSYLVRAVAWKHKGEVDKAIADLTEAIQLEPRSAHAYHSRGQLLAEKKNFEKAIDDYSQAIRLEPNQALGYCDRGFAWKALKEFDNAIGDYSEAVRLDPRDSDAYCGRGWAWREKQEFARSLSDFSQALRLNPRDACALDGRAWIFATSPNPTYRDGTKAVEVAIEACELTRWKEAYCLETLAAAYAEVGDFASAVKWQVKAIELEADPKEQEEYRSRLKLFQEKKPYREAKS